MTASFSDVDSSLLEKVRIAVWEEELRIAEDLNLFESLKEGLESAIKDIEL